MTPSLLSCPPVATTLNRSEVSVKMMMVERCGQAYEPSNTQR
jgi:hypothetical protein